MLKFFWLFYRQAPGWTFSQQRVVRVKKEKSRTMFLVCCNPNGEEKTSLMVIGNSYKARVFHGNSVVGNLTLIIGLTRGPK